MGIVGGPLLLWAGLSNAPNTDYEDYGRDVAIARRKTENKVIIAHQNVSKGIYTYVKV